MWRMTRAVAAEGLDLFFSPSVDSYFPVVNVPRKVLAIYDANIDEMPEVILPNRQARLLRWVKMRVALRQAGLVITGSAYSRAQIKSVLGVDESRIGIVPGGVDPIFRPAESVDRARQSVMDRYGVSHPYFLYVGGPGPTKNLPALAESFSALRREHEGVALVMVGKAERGGELETIARKLGPDARLLGFQADEALAELYQAALALVIPSLKEGYGLPAVEAVSCGTPAIVTMASPLPELLGAAAIAVDPHRASDITRAMRSMLSRETREAARSAAIALAGSFSWEHSARAAVELFKRVAQTGLNEYIVPK
jgi:glycosyltransferase involved in cell wall biosynthesis